MMSINSFGKRVLDVVKLDVVTIDILLFVGSLSCSATWHIDPQLLTKKYILYLHNFNPYEDFHWNIFVLSTLFDFIFHNGGIIHSIHPFF